MHRDDIIRMAVKCQLMTTANREGVYVEALERFAELVAAAEREECAKVCDDWAKTSYLSEAKSCARIILARSQA